jgi:hypothetical protein
MKILRKLVLVVLLLPIVLLLVSLLLPSRYRVQRDVLILAPADAVYPWLAQLRKWSEWTVWSTNFDATLTCAYSGPAEGQGSEMSWTARSGKGSLKLTAADLKTGVKYDLNFEDGRFLCSGAVALAAEESGTRVTFSNEGEFGRNPVRRYFGLFIDKKMGGIFVNNLHALKQKVEPKVN